MDVPTQRDASGSTMKERWNRLKFFAAFSVVAFLVVLALVVGSRLSDQAVTVLAGAVCGVSASIPTSLLIVAISRRREEPKAQQPAYPGAYPPVVIVAPPGTGPWAQPSQQGSYLPPSYSTPQPRQFKVVGGGAEVRDYDRYL